MTLSVVRAAVRPLARKTLAKPDLRKQLRRFAYRYRNTIQRITRQHGALADLAFSFPALLFALACPHKQLDRAVVVQAVIWGVPLKKLAKLAQIPFWMAKLPPEAFDQPLRPVPNDLVFNVRIGNALPKTPKQARRWLRSLYVLNDWGTGEFVLWALPRVLNHSPGSWELNCLRLIALHAWYSRHGTGLGATCILQPWHSTLSLENARVRAFSWLDMVKAEVRKTVALLDDVWFEPAVINGFAFEPLRDSQQIITEGRKMKNCIADYVQSVYSNNARLWKVTRDGKTVAIAEISTGNGLQLFAVTQLRGPANNSVAAEVALAVRRWQNTQSEQRLAPQKADDTAVFRQDKWREMWRPYWKHRGRAPAWLPFFGCEDNLCDLAYAGDI
jgi:PcfJ-like protein